MRHSSEIRAVDSFIQYLNERLRSPMDHTRVQIIENEDILSEIYDIFEDWQKGESGYVL